MKIMDGTEYMDFVDLSDIPSFDGIDDGPDAEEKENEMEDYAGRDIEEMLAGADAQETVKETVFQDLADHLAQYKLGQRSLRELESLYELLKHRRRGELAQPVRYSLLLECDFEEYGKQFIRDLSDTLRSYGLLDKGLVTLNEGGEYEEYDEDDDPCTMGKSVFRVVCRCEPAPVIDKLSGFSAQERMEQDLDRWEVFWRWEEQFLREHPNVIGVAIVSRKTVRSTWRSREHLYFRVFGHHIRLDDLPVENIRQKTFDALEELGLKMDPEFREKLDGYIQVVYPKADLKHEDFVSDLIDRILTAYYSVPELEESLTPRCVPYYRQPRSFDDIISRLDSLVGMDSVKKAFQELYYQNQNRGGSKIRLNMAFVGNPGTGKTTVAKMTADLLYSMGLTRTNKLVEAKPANLISPWIGQTSIQTRDICQSAYGGVLFIDEAYTLAYSHEMRGESSSSARCVETLLQEMEENADRLVVIFAGYPKEMERFLDSNEGLRSRVTRTISFPDYTEQELIRIFEEICAREKFTLAKESYEALRARIAYEKSGEHFGNARSIENIYQSVRAEWQKNQNAEQVFLPEHIRATMPEQRSSDIRDMIGLDEIKDQLRQFESRVRYIAAAREKGVQLPPLNLHMLFTGNPGTGKTSVARVIAEDLYKIGVLKTNKCICVEARDLIGDWNDAAKRTEKEIQRAMGGVLFLDEAYTLTEYASGNVGREVVSTLITAMEKYRGELLVILAGYPNNMRAFLNVNPGLTSRIGHTFHFRDYTVQELTDIFLAKMQKCGFLISGGVAEKVKSVMEYFHVIPDFGNGRFVDNVIDQTITRRSMREEDDPCRYNEITEADIPDVKMILDTLPDGERFWNPAGTTREEKRRTAVHEIGHALLSVLLDPETKLDTVSISNQAYSAGRVKFKRDSGVQTEDQLMNMITIALGGRDAERLIFGNHTTGCASDYAMAKRIAADMLEIYAMGPVIGRQNITTLLRQADQVAVERLKEHRELLLELAERLLERQELTDGEIRKYLTEFKEKQGTDGEGYCSGS